MPSLPASWLSWRPALPSQCAICRCWPARRLCADCCARWAAAVPRCRHCAIAVPAGVPVCGTCLRQPPPLDLCLAAVDYAYPWHAVIGDFKFRADTGLARPLAGLMDWMPGVDEALAWCDALLPMPLSDTRLRERGFHQTLLLARALARGRAALVPPRAIRRSHTATAQHDLPRSQRLRQLRSAFAVAPGQQALIAGRRLLLLDDVMTTGASLHALAHCLRRAGAAGVGALVLARTPL